jgi:hypothetical protein
MKKQKRSIFNSLVPKCPIMLLLTLGFMHYGIFAQTQATAAYIDTLMKYQADEGKVQVDTINPQFNVILGIRAFIIKSRNGFVHLSINDLNHGLNWANMYFKKAGMQFHYSSIDTLSEYEYASIRDINGTAEIEVKYARLNYINLFLVDTIIIDKKSTRGFTFFPGDTLHNSIFLQKTHAGDKTLTQLLGNFFGLLNTHENIGGSEHVNEDNCSSSGDFLCDTYADPDLKGMVDKNCMFMGTIVDGNRQYFVPSVANLMSNSPDNCKCIFSMGQYRRMIFYYQNFRSMLK